MASERVGGVLRVAAWLFVAGCLWSACTASPGGSGGDAELPTPDEAPIEPWSPEESYTCDGVAAEDVDACHDAVNETFYDDDGYDDGYYDDGYYDDGYYDDGYYDDGYQAEQDNYYP